MLHSIHNVVMVVPLAAQTASLGHRYKNTAFCVHVDRGHPRNRCIRSTRMTALVSVPCSMQKYGEADLPRVHLANVEYP